MKDIVTNRKARRDYTILETYEAGIELRGTEVKSIRQGNVQEALRNCDIDVFAMHCVLSATVKRNEVNIATY